MKDGSEGLSIFIWLALMVLAFLFWSWSMENWIQEEAKEVYIEMNQGKN